MTLGRIRVARAVGGGLLAGLIMNVSEYILHAAVLAPDSERLVEDWRRRGLGGEPEPLMLPILVLTTFALGVLAVWIYAAIRPRFGAGVGTAACAGLVVWTLSYLYTAVYVHAAVRVYPPRLTWVPVAWSLVAVPVATIAGAWIYRE